MPSLVIARSLSWRGRTESADLDSYTRIIEGASQAWLLIANATPGGFENTSPVLTRVLLDRACESIQVTEGDDVESRFTRCFEECHAFIQASAGAEDYEVAAGALSVVSVDDAAVRVRWLGGEEVWLFRGGELAARAAGHTVSLGAARTVMDGLGFGPVTDGHELMVPWPHGDAGRIVLLTRTVVDALGQDEVMRSSTIDSVPDTAESLIKRFDMASQTAHGAVVVAEVSR